jgi:hypothetical protein
MEGALNNQGEYRKWIHVKIRGTKTASMVYPYPFVGNTIDAVLLLSHWHMTKFEGWPVAWRTFEPDIAYLVQSVKGRTILWRLSTSLIDTGREPFDPIPESFLNAFAQSTPSRKKAGMVST